MNRLFIAPYKLYSSSAKLLADTLNIYRVNGNKKFKSSDIIINWGRSNLKIQGTNNVINNPNAVSIASNKLNTLLLLKDKVDVIPFTTNELEAKQWITNGDIVYGRQLLNSSRGDGINILSLDNINFIKCPLYTKGLLKAHEYRVHVAFNKVIDIQKKRRRNDTITNDLIKNINGGWVFCRDNVTAPIEIFNQAIKAINIIGLDFGAVDILYKHKENKIAILEINTAPGLEGLTLNNYSNAIRERIHYE